MDRGIVLDMTCTCPELELKLMHAAKLSIRPIKTTIIILDYQLMTYDHSRVADILGKRYATQDVAPTHTHTQTHVPVTDYLITTS